VLVQFMERRLSALSAVSIVLTAAADLGEHHRAKLPAADDDLDRVATDARQAALREELQRG